MIFSKFSLRTKSMLALVVACLVALVPTIWIGMDMLEKIRDHLGQAYAQNYTLLSAQRIEAPVSRELALAQRLADSVLLREWLLEHRSKTKRSRFFAQVEGYEQYFQGGNYFIVNRETLAYYFNGPDKEYSQEPRYFLDPDNPDDSWFFTTIKDFDTLPQLDCLWFRGHIRIGHIFLAKAVLPPEAAWKTSQSFCRRPRRKRNMLTRQKPMS